MRRRRVQPTDSRDNRFLIGLLVGAGVGLVATWLFAPKREASSREILLGRATDLTDRVASQGRVPGTWHDRRTERVARTLRDRIERIRSAGF